MHQTHHHITSQHKHYTSERPTRARHAGGASSLTGWCVPRGTGQPGAGRELELPSGTRRNDEAGVTMPVSVLLRFIAATGAEPHRLLTGRGHRCREARRPGSGVRQLALAGQADHDRRRGVDEVPRRAGRAGAQQAIRQPIVGLMDHQEVVAYGTLDPERSAGSQDNRFGAGAEASTVISNLTRTGTAMVRGIARVVQPRC
jgi:hypothetical protein